VQKETLKQPPQPMLPHGFGGRVFGVLMETFAASNYRWVLEQLSLTRPKTYLEVGFGTGKLAEMVARDLKPACICGVDPSELMRARTSGRLKRFAQTIEVDLRLGTSDDIPWDEQSFAAIVASHNFQFWNEPAATLRRLRRLVRADGRLVLVIRNHKNISRRVREWIPNPITKSGNELDGLRAALADAEFCVLVDEKLRSGSQGIVAACV
jgi:SAM-dependent methyltransferase